MAGSLAGLTLLGSITEGFVEVVCGLGETCGFCFLFGFCMDKGNPHSPVSEREAGDTTICAWSGRRLSASDVVASPRSPGSVRSTGAEVVHT
jgi:hypothetical protein